MNTLSAAQRRAKYGHRDWIVWSNKDGEEIAMPVTAENMKKCLLDVGTKGHWTLVHANDGTLSRGFWWMGLCIFHRHRRN